MGPGEKLILSHGQDGSSHSLR